MVQSSRPRGAPGDAHFCPWDSPAQNPPGAGERDLRGYLLTAGGFRKELPS